ncbi:MAG: hypothetical protein JRC86_00765 [Deltaproteobacteria bacterium]|nr:hypothetical protein [Deltaproteobacteria bacterium]
MASEWDWIRDLIAEQGRNVTLTKAAGIPDPAKPWEGNTAVADPLVVKALTVRYKANEVDNSHILHTDLKALVAVPLTGEDVLTYDIFTDTTGDGRTWKIEKPDKIEPGTEILLYILQLRR